MESTEVLEQPAPGKELIEPAYEDYFGFTERRKWYLPDGFQYIEFKIMTEGDRKRYQAETRADVTVERTSGNAKMSMDPGTERWTLIKSSVTDWHLMRKTNDGWRKAEFDKKSFETWLGGASPTLIDSLEKEIRKANPWLLQDMTVEDIDKEIVNLQEMRDVAVRREQGEPVSSGK